MAIIIGKAKDSSVNEPIILRNEDIVTLNKENVKNVVYGAEGPGNVSTQVTPDTSLSLDSTDIIKIPDVEFKYGSLESVLKTIGDSKYIKSIVTTNGKHNPAGTIPTMEAGQTYTPNAIIAKGKLVSSPIIGINVNSSMDDITPAGAAYEKELYIGISKINEISKKVTFEKLKITNHKEIYNLLVQVNGLLDTLVPVTKKSTDTTGMVTVSVTTEKGNVSQVNVSTANLAKASELTSLTSEVSDLSTNYNNFVKNTWNAQACNITVNDDNNVTGADGTLLSPFARLYVVKDNDGTIKLPDTHLHLTYAVQGIQAGILTSLNFDAYFNNAYAPEKKAITDLIGVTEDNYKAADTSIVNYINTKFSDITTVVNNSHAHTSISASDSSYVQLSIPASGKSLGNGTITTKYASYNVNTGVLTSDGIVTSNALTSAFIPINTRMSTAEELITNLFSNDRNRQTEISKLNSSVNGLTTNVNTLNTSVSNLTTNLAVLTERVSDNESDIAAINTNITNINGSIGTIKNQITTLTTNVSNISTNLSTLTSNVSDIKIDVTNLKNHESLTNTSINNINNNISTINTTLTTLLSSAHSHNAISGSDNKWISASIAKGTNGNLSTVMTITTTYHDVATKSNGIVDWAALKTYIDNLQSLIDELKQQIKDISVAPPATTDSYVPVFLTEA